MTQQVIDLDLLKVLCTNHEALFVGGKARVSHLSKNFQETAYFSSIILDQSHLSRGYADNCPCHVSFVITKLSDDKYTVTAPHGTKLLVKPFPHESWLAYSAITIPFRKTTGSLEKVIAALNKWQQKRLQAVIENYDIIMPDLNTTNLAYLNPANKAA